MDRREDPIPDSTLTGEGSSAFQFARARERWDRRFSILVADGLTETDKGGGLRPSRFASDVRQLFNGKASYCGLIALATSPVRRASDVDFLLSSETIDTAALRDRIVDVAHRLWYKAPPGCGARVVAGVDRSSTIRVTSDLNFEQFRQCLALRHEVYGLLGYLDEEVRDSPLKIEMDLFDSQALHFAALEQGGDRVLGTARLILPGNRNANARQSCETPFEEYCERLAGEDNTLLFSRRLHEGMPAAMPIFDAFPSRRNTEANSALPTNTAS